MVYFPRTFIAEYRVARTLPLLSSAGWWVNRWPFLGLLETAVKLCAFLAAAYVPLGASSAPPATALERAPFYAQTFLFFGGTVILSLAIFERVLMYRELISVAFVLPNIWAHWTVLAAMYRGRAAVSVFHFRVFLALMLAGDVVKLVFFAVHDFSMLNIARYVRANSVLDVVAYGGVFFAVSCLLTGLTFLSLSSVFSDYLLARLLLRYSIHPHFVA